MTVCVTADCIFLQTLCHAPVLQVDIDLAAEADASKVSRQQAQLSLHADGVFRLCNVGRRTVFVNGKPLGRFDSTRLEHLSLIDVGNIQLLFMLNQLAVGRLVTRSANVTL